MKYLLTTLALILFLLTSCGTQDTTGSTAPAPNYMSFILTNSGGDEVSPTTELSRGSTYGLVIKRESGASLPTENYDILTPADVIIINVTRTNSIDFTVNNTNKMTVTITATHKNNAAIRETLELRLASTDSVTDFQQDVENITTVPNLTNTKSSLTREVLEPLGVPTGTPLVKRYATETGDGTYDGSSWENAWAATNLRNGINRIADADASKVYLIMIAGGTYKPDYSTTVNREISFSMKNYVAIMGGFQAGGGWGRTDTTLMNGDIGTVNDNSDNSLHVFSHNSIPLGNSHLYGVTITNGNANGETSVQKRGGGMYNNSSSPNLTQVIFSGNRANTGGGMENTRSSPVLKNTVFSANSANRNGGGMYNSTSSPVLKNTVFSGNTANADGGGMFNSISFPILNNTVFSGNTANADGGGMFNFSSSPVLIGTVLSGNSAVNGGGMANENGPLMTGPRILNTIFSDNTVTTGVGPDIAMDIGGPFAGPEPITIVGSVLGTYLTTGQPTNAIVGYGGSDSITIKYHSASLSKNAVNLGTTTLTVNGMNFTYPTITSDSSAINLGLFIRKTGRSSATATYYYSTDEDTWYSGFTTVFTTTGGFSGNPVTPPPDAEDMTARDITGKVRTGRPDAGVNEL